MQSEIEWNLIQYGNRSVIGHDAPHYSSISLVSVTLALVSRETGGFITEMVAEVPPTSEPWRKLSRESRRSDALA